MASGRTATDGHRGVTDPSKSHRYSSSAEVERFRAGPRGTPADPEDTLRFAELSGVRPMIETYPLEELRKPTLA